MNLRLLLLPAFVLFVLAACSDRRSNAYREPFTMEATSDTLYQGELISIASRELPMSTLAQPERTLLRSKPPPVRTQKNEYTVTSRQVPQRSDQLIRVTPGKDGVPRPVIRKAGGRVQALLHPKPVRALPPRVKDAAIYDLQYLDVDQGLISSYIRTMLEDRFGNLWFGTSYGLSRYDGNSFIHYTSESGLTHNMVLATLEDSQGDIWLGTANGLTRYDGSQFIHYQLEEGFDGYWVRDILEDKWGDLWLGTKNGLIHYDRDLQGGSFVHYTTEQGLMHNQIHAILEDDRGFLWLGSEAGLTRFDGTSFTQYTTKAGLVDNRVITIAKDQKGDLWFATDGGVNRYDGNNFTYFSDSSGFFDQQIISVLEDRRGHIWFGTNSGLGRYTVKNEQGTLTKITADEGLSNNRARHLLEDGAGNLWIGTGGGGVNRYNGAGFAHYTEETGLSDNGVVFVHEDRQGALWFGTSQGLTRYFDSRFSHYTVQEGLADNEVYCVLEDSRSDLWFGTIDGLSHFDGKYFTTYGVPQGLSSPVVLSILEDHRGQIWLGTQKGVCRFDPALPAAGMTTFGLSDVVTHFQEDRFGRIWMATGNGAIRYDPDSTGGQFYRFGENNGLAQNIVTTFLEDKEGYFWIGTGGGLNRFSVNESGDFTDRLTYTMTDGLSNNYIWSLLKDRSNNIWVSTEKGITLLQPRGNASRQAPEWNETDYQFFSFNKEDGLKRLDFQANSVCLDNQNRIWWGTEGAAMLDLSQFELATQPPRSLSITQIDLGQKFVDYRSLNQSDKDQSPMVIDGLRSSLDSIVAFYNYPATLDLPYYQDHLTFYFTAIDWARPHRIEYQYYLEGLEAPWSNTGREPQVDYRNLNPDTYTFHIRARTDAPAWSDAYTYHFRIRPPLWATWWAFCFYALCIAGFLYLVYYRSRKQLLLKTQLQRRKEESAQAVQREHFIRNLYTNLTHEFRTPLNIILGMSEQIEAKPDRYLDKGLPMIRRNGEQLLRLTDQLLDLSKLEERSFQLDLQRSNIMSYIAYLVDSFKFFAEGEGLQLDFIAEPDKLTMDYDPEQFGHIMTNLISNAIKFTPAGGRITLTAHREAEALRLQVADTGIGIPQKELPRIFDRFYQVDTSITRQRQGTGIGLAHTRELVELMAGSIEVESTLKVGTTFTIVLPLHQQIPQGQTDPIQTGNLLINSKANHPEEPLLRAEDRRPWTPDRPRVLIIEDNRDALSYLQTCLEEKYDIDLAQNAQIGVEKALESIPDLIISDVMMPQRSGFDLCRSLKDDDRTSHIPIILLTAKVDQHSRIYGIESGADAYLHKPFNKRELLARLETILQKRKKLLAYFARKFEHGIALGSPSGEVLFRPTAEEEFIERVRAIVEENYADESFNLKSLCRNIGMSRSQLYRKMKALLDTKPSDFIRTYRLEKAKILLENTELNVTQVAIRTGYKDLGHFSRSFLDEFGISPSDVGK